MTQLISLIGKSQLFVVLCLASGSNGESDHIPEDVLGLKNTYQLITFTTKVGHRVFIFVHAHSFSESIAQPMMHANDFKLHGTSLSIVTFAIIEKYI